MQHSTSIGHPAAVYRVKRPRHKRALGAKKEKHHLGHLIGPTLALNGSGLVKWRVGWTVHLLEGSLHHRGIDGTRSDGIDADVAISILLGRGTRQTKDAVLAGTVDGAVGHGINAVNGSHVDNGPSIDNVAQLRAEAVHAAGQVNANDSIPFLIENVADRTRQSMRRNHASNVGRSIEASKLLDNAGDPVVDILAVSHIEPRCRVSSALALEISLGVFESRIVNIGDAGNTSALSDELGGGQPNAACTTSDGDDLVLDRHVC